MSSAPSQPPPPLLREARADDLDAVMTVMTRAFDPAFGEAWTRSQCSGILPMHGVSLTLAEDQRARIVGFMLMRLVADEAELLLLAVEPDDQRRGTGGELVRHFVERADQWGARRLHLEVRQSNPAVDFYRRLGFDPAGRRHGYYRGADGAPHDALTLVRMLISG